MEKIKLFGCHDFYVGGKIVAIISLVQNVLKVAVSLSFLIYINQDTFGSGMNKGERKK